MLGLKVDYRVIRLNGSDGVVFYLMSCRTSEGSSLNLLPIVAVSDLVH
jgi:hypothetical protein